MKYNAEYDKPRNYELPVPGPCKVKIIDAEETVSQSGNPMVKLKCEVVRGQIGQGHNLFDYVVDNPAVPEQFNTKTGSIFRSCLTPIDDGDITYQSFIGMEGTVMIRHEDYKGMPTAKLYYWIDPEQNKEDTIPF